MLDSMDNLKKLSTMKDAAPEAMGAFEAFNETLFKDGALPTKTKELIALAVGISKQCSYCIEVHRRAAGRAGASEAELVEAGLVAAAIGAGAAVTHTTHAIQ